MSTPIETFFGAWEIQEADARASALRSCVDEGVYYADPSTPVPLSGLVELVDHLSNFTATQPGATARVVAQSRQNTHLRATVEFRMNDTTAMRGQYFCDLNTEGQICKIVGFIGTGDDA